MNAVQTNLKMEILTVGKYTFKVEELQNSRFNSRVLVLESRPKAKYLKEKIVENYGFKSFIDAMEYAKDKHQRWTIRLEERQKEIAERRRQNSEVKASDFYQIGDIIENTWGYEQTNIEFYKVTKVLNKMIEIVEIGKNMEKGSMYAHGMACNVIPDPENVLETTYRLKVKSKGCLSNPERYYYFHKWDGRPSYKSWYY